jgi:D-alanyl-D-alanine carboxypeptidase
VDAQKDVVAAGEMPSSLLQYEIKLAKILIDKPAPHVTAASWVVLDCESRQILFGRLEKERREVASLTKIMTFYTALQLADRFQISLKEKVAVSKEAAET